ncbi:MAG: hypothetical protein F7C35_03195 [Desulfurococcales archaeon]|nr:hypothetical protein [Desulfurococcales archaeon]
MSREVEGQSGSVKDHIAYASDLDILIPLTQRVPMFDVTFGYYTGYGNPLFSLGGGVVYSVLKYIVLKYHVLKGYKVIETPIIARTTLYKLSGHLDMYRENMFVFDLEGDEYALKPMNCPFHILAFISLVERYGNRLKLPFKVFELGTVHRDERSGSLRGLMRARRFTQDDAHIFTTESMIVPSILNVFRELKEIYEKLFHMPVTKESVTLRVSLSDRERIGEKYLGTPEEWELAEGKLREIAEEIKKEYGIEYYEARGEAAFYGPKLDVVAFIEDRRTGEKKDWQIGTIQFDFNLPKKFRLNEIVRKYTDVDEKVYMIHRALLGSLERFMGVYLERYQGRLVFPLAPLQVLIIGITTGDEEVDKQIAQQVNTVEEGLVKEGYRAVGKLVAKTRLSGYVRKVESTIKPPVIAYIGKREVARGEVALSIYDLAKRRRVKETVQGLPGVLSKLDEIEAPVRELIGEDPRLPVILDYLAPQE